jgi:hypothetical protein
MKNIQITDTSTGESYTGTIVQVALGFKLNPKTISRWVKTGHPPQNYQLKTDIEDQKTDILPKPDIPPIPKPDIPTQPIEHQQTKTDITQAGDNLTTSDLNEINKFSPISQPKPTKQLNYLPHGKCVKCGKIVYHIAIINNKQMFICFNGICLPNTQKKIPKQPSKQQLDYIQQFIHDNSKLSKSITKASDLY